MSLEYGFFNSKNGDRRYNAIDVSEFFDGLIWDGVYMHIGDRMMVTPMAILGVQVGTGRAWFNHVWTVVKNVPYTLELKAADRSYPRIDSVVIEINEEKRTSSIKILTGVPSADPTSPFSLIRPQEKVHYYRLADVAVARNATTLTQSAITNYVGTSGTPFVTAVLDGMDIDALIAQWHTQWIEWFSWVVGVLDENYVGHLALWLKDLQAEVDDHVVWDQNEHTQIGNLITSMNERIQQLTNQVAALKEQVDDMQGSWSDAEDQGFITKGLIDSNEQPILDSDGNQILGAVNVIIGGDYTPAEVIETFEGPYYVESKAVDTQTLNTENKIMKSNLIVGSVPVSYAENADGGIVVEIAK